MYTTLSVPRSGLRTHGLWNALAQYRPSMAPYSVRLFSVIEQTIITFSSFHYHDRHDHHPSSHCHLDHLLLLLLLEKKKGRKSFCSLFFFLPSLSHVNSMHMIASHSVIHVMSCHVMSCQIKYYNIISHVQYHSHTSTTLYSCLCIKNSPSFSTVGYSYIVSLLLLSFFS